ncbi:hypothetical protein [Nostoc parmelioides]|uniref:Uncharacterized protein n=1 Tax=Nostoc parmelioides FACHB-3921 TaxID=2692909 RepID=A0ABR8BNW0_9NOSO|nr:hypothetical protein [Nostoc parmelioides]MBD2255823.1 hypothetical protein [Nostoc parmelioides FACHB-3921]
MGYTNLIHNIIGAEFKLYSESISFGDKEMSEEPQIDKDKVATGKDSSTKESSSQQKRDYAKWMGVAATFLSIFLAFLTYKLDAERRNAENRQGELNSRLEEIRARVDIDYNLYSEGAVTFLQKKQSRNNSNRLFSNEVSNQILKQTRMQRWDSYNNLMRCVYGYFPDAPKVGMLGTREIIYFEVSYNPSADSKKIPADAVEIAYRIKDFPRIPQDGSLTFKSSFAELTKDIKSWKTGTLKVEQLKAGNKITIPIAHMVGPVHSESLVIPMKISWYNPLLNRKEEKSFDIEGMMSDLDARYRGFLRGNVKGSCNAV